MRRQLLAGLLGGAAGTSALNAVTFLDMAVRGRPESVLPERGVERLTGLVGLKVPGEGDQRRNRLKGLAPLLGFLVGTSAGAAYGAVIAVVGRPPVLVGGLLAGSVAMVGANGPMAVLGITDPRSWTAQDWVADVLPHLAFGLVTAATVDMAT